MAPHTTTAGTSGSTREVSPMSTTTILAGSEDRLRALMAGPAEEYLAVCEVEAAAFAEGFASIRSGEIHATGWAACHGLTVSSTSFGQPPADVADDLDALVAWTKTAPTIGAVLTEDGRPAHSAVWHAGAPTGDPVYFEVYTAAGDELRQVHGYVDPTSRRVVQYG